MGCSKHCWWCGAGLSDFWIDFIEQCIGIINVGEYILNTQTGLSNTFWLQIQYILSPEKTCIIQIQYITITSLLSSIHLIHLTIPHSIHPGLPHYISVHPTMVAQYILPNLNTSNTSFLGPAIQPTVHPVNFQYISIHPQYLNWYILGLSSIHHSIHPAKITIHPIHTSIHFNTSCHFSIHPMYWTMYWMY